MKKNKKLNIYEYIDVYVDDLCIAAQDPKEIINVLKSKYHLKVKGDGPLTYHLGADYFQDPDGTIVSQPKKYIEKLKETYIRLFDTEPSKGLKTPLEKNDHPELDTSETLEGQEVNHYLTMVGQLQWLITLGRFDIQAQVITMSRFRAQPRKGHLDWLKRIYAYVIRTKDYATRFRTTEPDYSYLPDQNFDWAHTVYGNVHEIIPDDIPDPLGKSVTTTTTVNANLNHCLATGRSVTGCLHFVNHTPIDSYSKRQATVETATYGSGFVASKTATEQIIDLRHTLRYLGVPIKTKSYLFGDNRSVVTSSTLPHSTLGKRHNILAYHRVREVIQFPPEMDENWVRYGLAKLGQISRLPNWQRMLFCAYTTQLLHSTGEVCWNNKDSYFIWFEFVCRNSGQIASRRSWKRSCLGLEYTSKCSRLALLWEPN